MLHNIDSVQNAASASCLREEPSPISAVSQQMSLDSLQHGHLGNRTAHDPQIFIHITSSNPRIGSRYQAQSVALKHRCQGFGIIYSDVRGFVSVRLLRGLRINPLPSHLAATTAAVQLSLSAWCFCSVKEEKLILGKLRCLRSSC